MSWERESKVSANKLSELRDHVDPYIRKGICNRSTTKTTKKSIEIFINVNISRVTRIAFTIFFHN